MECSEFYAFFGLFPRAPQFLPQRISGSGYETGRSSEVFKPFNVCFVNYDEGIRVISINVTWQKSEAVENRIQCCRGNIIQCCQQYCLHCSGAAMYLGNKYIVQYCLQPGTTMGIPKKIHTPPMS